MYCTGHIFSMNYNKINNVLPKQLFKQCIKYWHHSMHAAVLKLNSWVSFSEKRQSFGPIFCLSLTSLWCVTPPLHIPQLGNQPYYSSVTNNQDSLLATHCSISCTVCGRHLCMCLHACQRVFFLQRGVYDDFVCAQWVVSTLRWIAVRWAALRL